MLECSTHRRSVKRSTQQFRRCTGGSQSARSRDHSVREKIMIARSDLRCLSASIATTSVAFIVIAIVILGEGGAYAQSAEAEASFNEGNRLMAEGKLAQACE